MSTGDSDAGQQANSEEGKQNYPNTLLSGNHELAIFSLINTSQSALAAKQLPPRVFSTNQAAPLQRGKWRFNRLVIFQFV